MRILFELENFDLHTLLFELYGDEEDITDALIGSFALYVDRTLGCPISNDLLYYIDRLTIRDRCSVIRLLERNKVVDYYALARTLKDFSHVSSIRYFGCRTFIIRAD